MPQPVHQPTHISPFTPSKRLAFCLVRFRGPGCCCCARLGYSLGLEQLETLSPSRQSNTRQSMFPTFTGNSRKARNVNLSGQRTTNPFTSTSWSPGSSLGASKTVEQAKAERQQRQLERARQAAVSRIQRIWLGYRLRKSLRSSRLQILESLYSDSTKHDAEQRSIQAFPLLMSLYSAARPEDSKWLLIVVDDLVKTDFAAFTSGAIEAPRMGHLASLIVATLGR